MSPHRKRPGDPGYLPNVPGYGGSAYRRGFRLDANPYREGTPWNAKWRECWLICQERGVLKEPANEHEQERPQYGDDVAEAWWTKSDPPYSVTPFYYSAAPFCVLTTHRDA